MTFSLLMLLMLRCSCAAGSDHHHVLYSDSRNSLGEEGCDYDIKPDSVHIPTTTDVSVLSW